MGPDWSAHTRVVREPGVSESGGSATPRSGLQTKPWFGYVAYLGGIMLFSLNGSASAAIMKAGVSPERLSQLRATAAFAVLLIISVAVRPRALRATKKEIGLLAAYGVLGMLPVQYLYFIAIHRLPVGIALLIEYTAPVMIALWIRFVRRQQLGRGLWSGLFLSLVGLALVARVWAGLTLDAWGVVAAFGAAVSLMVWYLVGERAVGGRDPLTMTTWSFGYVALAWAAVLPWTSFPWSTLSGQQTLTTSGGTLTLATMLLVIYMVLFGTVASFSLVNVALRHLGASRASVVGMTEPVLSGLVAWVVLGQHLQLVQVLGGFVVLGGVFLAEMSRNQNVPTTVEHA